MPLLFSDAVIGLWKLNIAACPDPQPTPVPQENYETNIAPIAGQYDKMVAGMGEIYQTAVDGHTKGIELLKKDFGYHPAYKRHDDKFTATPFKPL